MSRQRVGNYTRPTTPHSTAPGPRQENANFIGAPDRFKTLGELVAEIYRAMWEYNHTRIHSALRMPPAAFAEKLAALQKQKIGGQFAEKLIETVSKEMVPLQTFSPSQRSRLVFCTAF